MPLGLTIGIVVSLSKYSKKESTIPYYNSFTDLSIKCVTIETDTQLFHVSLRKGST